MTDFEKTVLSAVNAHCNKTIGFVTSDVAFLVGRQPGRESNRQHSALVGYALRSLHKQGLVAHLDDRKPVIWTKVA